ncbi:MAG: hypothetical protein ACM3SX_15815 [Deltaproteobacteria bacterium]
MRKIVLALAVAAACGGSGTDAVAPASTEVGSYTLLSLNGHPLPATVTEGSTTTDVLSGGLTLMSGGTLSMRVVYQLIGQTTPVTNDLTGHYTRQGSSLSFTYNNGGANTGTLTSDTLRMSNEGAIWLFARQ